MKKLPISVFIIAKNEEERLPKAIASVKDWVDEVIVIDSGSEDKTVEIAKNMGAQTTFNEWQGYGQQKIFGESLCKNDWILNIDADEEVTPDLRNNILSLFKNAQPVYDAYKMRWKMLFFTQKRPPLLAVGSNFIRLYNKQKAGFRESIIHDSVILKDESARVGELKGYVHHRCFLSMDQWAKKVNYITSVQAEDWLTRGRKKPSTLRMIIEPIFAFLKSYFLRRYFLYGIDGYNASIIYAYSKTLRLAKVREKYLIQGKNSKKQ
jgi:glycosyltransferase involved in cell wall biosynthesis